jgi:hypothetical protein
MYDAISNLNKNLKIDININHRNQSKINGYRAYYDINTWNLIANTFKSDIEIFGYDDTKFNDS